MTELMLLRELLTLYMFKDLLRPLSKGKGAFTSAVLCCPSF